MPTESGYKKNVTSGFVSISDRLQEPIKVPLPVGPSKKDEAAELIRDVWAVIRKHYLSSHNLSPLDVARCLVSVAGVWENKSLRITEEKYNGKASKPRVEVEHVARDN